jgi:hypothetical protein
MAYSSTNPPRLIGQGITGNKHWLYESTDVSTAVDDTDYFTNGYDLGMRVGDRVSSVVSSSYNQSIGVVSVASSSGPCTVIFGGLVST